MGRNEMDKDEVSSFFWALIPLALERLVADQEIGTEIENLKNQRGNTQVDTLQQCLSRIQKLAGSSRFSRVAQELQGIWDIYFGEDPNKSTKRSFKEVIQKLDHLELVMKAMVTSQTLSQNPGESAQDSSADPQNLEVQILGILDKPEVALKLVSPRNAVRLNSSPLPTPIRALLVTLNQGDSDFAGVYWNIRQMFPEFSKSVHTVYDWARGKGSPSDEDRACLYQWLLPQARILEKIDLSELETAMGSQNSRLHEIEENLKWLLTAKSSLLPPLPKDFRPGKNDPLIIRALIYLRLEMADGGLRTLLVQGGVLYGRSLTPKRLDQWLSGEMKLKNRHALNAAILPELQRRLGPKEV